MKKKLINFLTYFYYKIFRLKYDLIIFSHVPQCGGNTVLHIFKFFFGYRFLIIERNEIKFYIKNPKILEKNLKGKILILGHFGFDFVMFLEKYYRKKRIFFLFNMRDPKKRIQSNYFRNKKLNKSKINFSKFLHLRKKQKLDNIYLRFLSGKDIYNSNKSKLTSKLVLNAKKNITRFHHIIILENFHNEMKIVLKKLLFFSIPIYLFNFHKNNVSNSKFPIMSKSEKRQINLLTKLDYKIYNIVKNHGIKNRI